jgi:hypothetical protein
MIVQMTEMPEEAILICELADPYESMADSKAVGAAAHKFYQQLNKPISLIVFARKDIQVSFSDAMIGIGILTRGEHALNSIPLTLYNIADNITPPIKIILDAITKGLYGAMKIKTAKTIDEALTMIRAGK